MPDAEVHIDLNGTTRSVGLLHRHVARRTETVAFAIPPTRRALLCTTAVAFCLSFGPASAQQPVATPVLTSDQNFRDVAGIAASAGGTDFANMTTHGGTMRTGVFDRSEALTSLSARDWSTLSSLGIGLGLDLDLRTPSEINNTPSATKPNASPAWVPAGARYLNVNIFGTYAPPPRRGSPVRRRRSPA